MNEHAVTRKGRLFWLLAVGLMVFATQVTASVVVVKTGVAYPRSEKDYGNKERLRQRAIRDAMELALMETHGVRITAERGGLDYSRQTHEGRDGHTSETFSRKTTYHVNARTRLNGGVKLLKIIRERWEGEKYVVKLKLDVLDDKELKKANTVGALWRRVGRPEVTLEAKVKRNDEAWRREISLQNYLRKELGQNGVETQTRHTGRYHIRVWGTLENRYLYEYGTWKALCELSFSIVDSEAERNRAVQRLRSGPAAGFSEKEAENNCLEQASTGFSRMMLEELARLFSDEWANGRDFRILIDDMPDTLVGEVQQTLARILGIRTAENSRFSDGDFSMRVGYQGQPLELMEAVSLALGEVGVRVRFRELRGNQIEFVWQDSGH